MRNAFWLPGIFVFSTLAVAAAERVTATGKVVDSSGQPIAHAAVMVYSAAVRTGFDLYCPTCYVDCGKRTFTGADGTYTIAGLSTDLLFDLLIVKEGYAANMRKRVDPLARESDSATLKQRSAPEDPLQTVRGRVVSSQGKPVRDALVEQQGALFPQGRSFGPSGWRDLIAVSNEQGEFELSYDKPLEAAIVQVSPRGMASKLATIPAGASRATVTATQGATVRGRLLRDGKPLAHMEIGLATYSRISGEAMAEVRIGTDEEGRFAITNVPAGRVWNVYPKMASLAPLNVSGGILQCTTKDDGEEVDLGDIPAKPAYQLSGRVTLSDGKPIPGGMRVNLSASRAQDSQTVMLPAEGTFEFSGLEPGVYNVTAAVKGYRLRDTMYQEVLVQRDTRNVSVVLQPMNARP